MVLAHSRALKTSGSTVVIQADLREPQVIVDHPGTRKLIDFTRPVAVLLVAVLHFIGDGDDPPGIVATIRDILPPGSYLVVSHAASGIRREAAAMAAERYKTVISDATLRSREEILRFFAGLELVGPGLVQVPRWRPVNPEPADAEKVWILGGVGRKPPAKRM